MCTVWAAKRSASRRPSCAGRSDRARTAHRAVLGHRRHHALAGEVEISNPRYARAYNGFRDAPFRAFCFLGFHLPRFMAALPLRTATPNSLSSSLFQTGNRIREADRRDPPGAMHDEIRFEGFGPTLDGPCVRCARVCCGSLTQTHQLCFLHRLPSVRLPAGTRMGSGGSCAWGRVFQGAPDNGGARPPVSYVVS